MITQDITFSSEMERASVNTNFNKPYIPEQCLLTTSPLVPQSRMGYDYLTLPFPVRWGGFPLTPTSTSRIYQSNVY